MGEFIQQNQDLLIVLFFAFAVISLGIAGFLGYRLHFSEKKADQRLKQARADITDMTILFQTMRDIIGQQKSLAKDFNEELEHKMEQVRHILNQGMEKNKQLYDKQQRIVAELEEAQAQLDGIFRQIEHLRRMPELANPARNNAVHRPAAASRTTTAPAAPSPSQAAPQPAANAVPPVAPPQPASPPTQAVPAPRAESEARTEARESPAARKPLLPRTPRTPMDANANDRAVKGLSPEEKARLADTGVTRAPFTSWVAEDLGDSARPTPARPAREAEPDPAGAGPSNGDAAREAFRALLNMPAAPRREPEPAPLDVLPKSDFTPESELSKRDVPDTMSVPLQQRVLEYSEAGMTVAQVSRELGIGKGEVRLMLSLARQQSPPPE